MTTLAGHVVRLEPLADRHSQDLFEALGNDDEAWRWMIVPTPRTVDEMSAIVARYLKEVSGGTREAFAVVQAESGKIIGTTSLMDISRHDLTVEIGSTIYARKFWRTAVNTETKLLLLTEAFEVQSFRRVTLKTDAENKRSQAAIARIGATYEGTLRSHRLRADGTSRDSMYYSILKSEWPQVKVALQEALA